MSRKKVLLIYPGTITAQTRRMPLAILYLAESLIYTGEYDPILLDLQVDVFDKTWLQDVKFVGISSLTGKQISYGLEVAKKIREINPTIPIIWGGIHATIMPEQTLEHPLVDYIVQGEGEETFPLLLNALSVNKNLSNLAGIVYKANNKIIITQRRQFINFNKYNKLPYDLLSLSKYQTKLRFEYQSSRGCPYGCAFCYNKQFNFFRWRFKEPAIVLDELESIKKRFDSKYLYLVDDEFFVNKTRAFSIIKGMVERNLDFKWKPAIRVDQVNRLTEDDFDLLYKSGCFEFCMGAESGSNRILKFINKKITTEAIYESAKKTKNISIVPQYSFMAGFPTETLEEFHETLTCIDNLWNINKKIKVNGLFLLTPFPGTEIFEIVRKIKNFKLPKNLEEWSKMDYMYAKRDVAYLPKKLYKEIKNYVVIVRFLFLWMHSSSFLKEKGNITTIKFYKFILFKLLFFPFYLIIWMRWKKRFIKFPIDIAIIKNTLFKLSP